MSPETYQVGKHHDPVIRLSTQNSPDTLGRMSHGVERQKVVLADPIRVSQELEASFQDATLRVLDKGQMNELEKA